MTRLEFVQHEPDEEFASEWDYFELQVELDSKSAHDVRRAESIARYVYAHADPEYVDRDYVIDRDWLPHFFKKAVEAGEQIPYLKVPVRIPSERTPTALPEFLAVVDAAQSADYPVPVRPVAPRVRQLYGGLRPSSVHADISERVGRLSVAGTQKNPSARNSDGFFEDDAD